VRRNGADGGMVKTRGAMIIKMHVPDAARHTWMRGDSLES
jgi:hypothetical protein